jgi:hypothetical protein
LIALGAFAVHQLRYLVGGALAVPDHGYLESVLPVLVLLGLSSVFGSVMVAARDRRGLPPSRAASWTVCTIALLAVFGVQETAEGGLATALGHGSWAALPIAIAVGRLVSLLLSGLSVVERRVAGVRPRVAARGQAVLGRARPCEAQPLACAALAFGLARRPPPRSFAY